ncbi:MAG: hypothetical protein IJW82_02360 [Clostridia bacterium]|nr:hypothetical protein [Clostridia bacterium]
MDKNFDELEMLETLSNALNDNPSTKTLNDFDEEDQHILKGVLTLFEKHCKRIIFSNFILISSKIVKLLSILFLALLVLKIFPYYIFVIILLLLNPILSIISKKLFYKIFYEHKKIENLIKPYDIDFNDLFHIFEDYNK